MELVGAEALSLSLNLCVLRAPAADHGCSHTHGYRYRQETKICMACCRTQSVGSQLKSTPNVLGADQSVTRSTGFAYASVFLAMSSLAMVKLLWMWEFLQHPSQSRDMCQFDSTLTMTFKSRAFALGSALDLGKSAILHEPSTRPGHPWASSSR
ncbi:hypothetical protein BKA66DRAFT_171717 [Pyrenochaeta sp. MPI-SDFR-AT-0127]|nr:hypothetical protein BKA66DRAFT_171717 [Pyrenochaeta sp. MPI-SDFR-AT-0127]